MFISPSISIIIKQLKTYLVDANPPQIILLARLSDRVHAARQSRRHRPPHATNDPKLLREDEPFPLQLEQLGRTGGGVFPHLFGFVHGLQDGHVQLLQSRQDVDVLSQIGTKVLWQKRRVGHKMTPHDRRRWVADPADPEKLHT